MGKSSVSDLSEHVFDLIQELFAIDPLLLVSVMPQLEFKLKVRGTHTHAHTHIQAHTKMPYIRNRTSFIFGGWGAPVITRASL